MSPWVSHPAFNTNTTSTIFFKYYFVKRFLRVLVYWVAPNGEFETQSLSCTKCWNSVGLKTNFFHFLDIYAKNTRLTHATFHAPLIKIKNLDFVDSWLMTPPGGHPQGRKNLSLHGVTKHISKNLFHVSLPPHTRILKKKILFKNFDIFDFS